MPSFKHNYTFSIFLRTCPFRLALSSWNRWARWLWWLRGQSTVLRDMRSVRSTRMPSLIMSPSLPPFFSVHTLICFWSLSTSQYGIHSYWAACATRSVLCGRSKYIVIRFTKTSGENLLWHTVVPNTVICLSVSVCMFNDTFCLFLCQFAYDKEPEVNVTFYVKLKGTEKKIDSTLRGIFKWIWFIIAFRGRNNLWNCIHPVNMWIFKF